MLLQVSPRCFNEQVIVSPGREQSNKLVKAVAKKQLPNKLKLGKMTGVVSLIAKRIADEDRLSECRNMALSPRSYSRHVRTHAHQNVRTASQREVSVGETS